MSEVHQFRKDPATGGFSEDRLSESPLPLKVCENPACKGGGYYVGERCGACVVTDDDDDDVDEPTTDEPTQPELPPESDPPGGSD